MRRIHEINREIVASPTNLALRLEYADAIEAKDPQVAEYVRDGVAGGGVNTDVQNRMAQAMPTGFAPRFNRGFVEEILVDPYVFMNAGASVLDEYPIRHVEFRPGGATGERLLERIRTPSPVAEIVHCPLLRRMRSVRFCQSPAAFWVFREDDLRLLASCPYWDNLLNLEVPYVAFKDADASWREFFATPRMRSLLRFEANPFGEAVPWERGLSQLATEFDGSELVTTPRSTLADELEREYGYIPALHRLESKYHRLFDLTERFERGEAPRFPVGAPLVPAMLEQPAVRKYPVHTD